MLLLAGCAGGAGEPPPAQPVQPQTESLLPGTIGIVVEPGQGGVVVAELRPGGRGAAAGLHQGDTIVRYNGVAVSSVREFNRLVLDTRPGSRATLEVQRAGSPRRLEAWVGQLDTMPRT